ncbi:hypothetical protein T265_14620, partial [Opisthorchis viverrini]
ARRGSWGHVTIQIAQFCPFKTNLAKGYWQVGEVDSSFTYHSGTLDSVPDRSTLPSKGTLENGYSGDEFASNDAAYLLYSVIDASIALATKGLAKILCYINTYPATHLSRALHVKLTWARKCNKHLFMSSETDKELGAPVLNITRCEAVSDVK